MCDVHLSNTYQNRDKVDGKEKEVNSHGKKIDGGTKTRNSWLNWRMTTVQVGQKWRKSEKKVKSEYNLKVLRNWGGANKRVWVTKKNLVSAIKLTLLVVRGDTYPTVNIELSSQPSSQQSPTTHCCKSQWPTQWRCKSEVGNDRLLSHGPRSTIYFQLPCRWQ